MSLNGDLSIMCSQADLSDLKDKVQFVDGIVHDLYSGKDISEDEYETFKNNFNSDIYQLIVLRYKLNDMFKWPSKLKLDSNKMFDILKEFIECDFKNIGLYISYPFIEEIIRWRLIHHI